MADIRSFLKLLGEQLQPSDIIEIKFLLEDFFQVRISPRCKNGSGYFDPNLVGFLGVHFAVVVGRGGGVVQLPFLSKTR